jgi:hypothetical protein
MNSREQETTAADKNNNGYGSDSNDDENENDFGESGDEER